MDCFVLEKEEFFNRYIIETISNNIKNDNKNDFFLTDDDTHHCLVDESDIDFCKEYIKIIFLYEKDKNPTVYFYTESDSLKRYIELYFYKLQKQGE